MLRNFKKIEDGQPNLEDVLLDLIGREDISGLQLPDPSTLSYYKERAERTLWFCQDVDVNLLEYSKQIIEWNREDRDIPVEKRKPIKLFIYTYGGELDACRHFIDLMILSKTPIYTYNIGIACSCGFYMLIAGHKRFAFPRSKALCHQGSAGFEGNAEEVKSHADQYKIELQMFADFTLERTKIDKALFKKKQKTEWSINGDEQLKYGLVDEMVTDLDVLLN